MMKKSIVKFKALQLKTTLFLLILLAFSGLFAQDIWDTHIAYEHISNQKYKFISKIVRNCVESPVYGVKFYAVGFKNNVPYGDTVSFLTNRTSIRKVENSCKSNQNFCDTPNTKNNLGFETHTFESIVDFSNKALDTFLKTGVYEFYFFSEVCCRTNITTFSPVTGKTIAYCYMNYGNILKTQSKSNNSPKLLPLQDFLICCNLTKTIVLTGIDSFEENGLKYELASSMYSAPVGNVAYASPYSYKYPLKPYCIPTSSVSCTQNPNAKPARGFFFDTTNTTIKFTPTNCSQKAGLAYNCLEYGIDTAGKICLLSILHREFSIKVVDDCGYNSYPVLSGPSVQHVCYGRSVSINIKSTDETWVPNQIVPDTTLINAVVLPKGATFKIADTLAREKQGTLSWFPDTIAIRKEPYYAVFNTTDQYCNLPGYSAFLVAIYLHKKIEFFKTIQISPSCGKVKLKANYKKGDALNFIWSLYDSAKQLVFTDHIDETMVQLSNPGKYYLSVTGTDNNCSMQQNDSFILSFKYPQPIEVLPVKQQCVNSGIVNLNSLVKYTGTNSSNNSTLTVYGRKLTPAHANLSTIISKVSPNQYIANPQLVFNSIGVPYRETLYFRIIDSLGCEFIDSSQELVVHPYPEISLLKDSVCQNEGGYPLDKLVLKPKPQDSISLWSFNLVSTPAGVQTNGIIYKKFSGQGGDYLDLGQSLDRKGIYGIEYCYSINNTGCSNCDTTSLIEKISPSITHTDPNDIYSTDTGIDLAKFVIRNGLSLQWSIKDSFSVIAFKGSKNNIPVNYYGVLRKHYFYSIPDSIGTWTIAYKGLGDCGFVFDTFYINTLKVPTNKVSSVSVKEWIKILPNPNNGIFLVQSLTDPIKTIAISDNLGRLIYSESRPKGNQKAVEVKIVQPPGIYFIRVNNGMWSKIVLR